MKHKKWNRILSGSMLSLLAAACFLFASCSRELPDEQKTYVPEAASVFILYRPGTPNEAYEAGLSALCAGEYPASITAFQTALAEQEQTLGKAHPDIAMTLSGLGAAYTWWVDYPKAEEQMRRALEIAEKTWGESSEKTAAAYQNLAIVCTRIPKLEEAEKLYQKTIEIGNQLPEESGSDSVCYQNNLAAYLIMVGNHEYAQNILTTNLSKLETDTKNKKILKSAMESNLGTYFYGTIGFDQALKYCKSTRKAYQKIFGEDHPNTMAVAGEMALIYWAGGEYDKALDIDFIVLDALSGKLGKNHHYLSDTYNNMGMCYDGKNESEKAIEYFQLAIENVKENRVRKETMASGYNGIAAVYEKEGEIDKAMDNIMKAYFIYKKYQVSTKSLDFYLNSIKKLYEMYEYDERDFDVWFAEQTPQYEALVETLVNP